MAKKPSTLVSLETLRKLWDDNQVAQKLAAGVFTTSLTSPTESGDPEYAGEFSVLVLVKTKNGRHVATIHQMIDRTGRVLDHVGYRHPPHPKAYRLRDGTLLRTVEKEEISPPPRKRRQRQANRRKTERME